MQFIHTGTDDPGATARTAVRALAATQLASTAGRSYNSLMIRASVSALKNGLSEYLRKVRAGQTVIVYDRDVPIARIERIESGARDRDQLARLRAAGITRPPSKPLSASEIAALAPSIARRARALEALLADRAEER